jgi:hypothetical protein
MAGAAVDHKAYIIVRNSDGGVSLRAETGWLDESMANQAASVLIAQIEALSELQEWGWREAYTAPNTHEIHLPDVRKV